MTWAPHFDIDVATVVDKPELPRRQIVRMGAGQCRVHTVTVTGGSYERKEWDRTVEVYISPTGRSVRVYVDGKEVPK